jgi:hypothetical protein
MVNLNEWTGWFTGEERIVLGDLNPYSCLYNNLSMYVLDNVSRNCVHKLKLPRVVVSVMLLFRILRAIFISS